MTMLNKAIIHYTSPALCTSVTPFPTLGNAAYHQINVPEEDQDTDIGNMHKKFGKDRVCGSRDMLMTDRQTCSSQYFATTPMGEVTMAA